MTGRASTTSHAMPGPDDVHVFNFDNGLTLYVRENHAAPVAVLEGYLPTGAIHDPDDLPGLASFVADMLTRGSEAYAYDEFNELVEGVGATVDVSGDMHVTQLSASGLVEDFPHLIRILADGIRRPRFDSTQIELLRTQTLVYQQEREQDTQRMAALGFYASMYGDHPYGRPVTGYAEAVARMSQVDMIEFHRTRFTPQGAILVVSGAVEPSAIADLIGGQLGNWTGSAPASLPAPPVAGPAVAKIETDLPGKFQSDLILGFPAVARKHADFYAIRVANTILGRFGMMGRLGERIREEEGLAYYCYSNQDADLLGGVWYAAAGVNPANTEQVYVGMREECQRLADAPVSEQELADTQAYLTGIVPLTLETNEGIAATLLSMAWYDLGLDFLYGYDDIINAVSIADVQRVAQAYLHPQRSVLSLAGPQA